MALVKETITQGLIAACTAVMNDTSDDREGTLANVADGFAQVIVDAIKSATITSPTGPCTIL